MLFFQMLFLQMLFLKILFLQILIFQIMLLQMLFTYIQHLQKNFLYYEHRHHNTTLIYPHLIYLIYLMSKYQSICFTYQFANAIKLALLSFVICWASLHFAIPHFQRAGFNYLKHEQDYHHFYANPLIYQNVLNFQHNAAVDLILLQ